MKKTLGTRISDCRREKKLTQDELADKLGVSPQAVSKWENDVCCPDIMLLPRLAAILGVSVDSLLSGEEELPPKTRVLKENERKSADELTLFVIINSSDGDVVKVTLPMALVKVGIELGLSMPKVSEKWALDEIDLKKVIELVDRGLYGKLIEVQSADGDNIVVSVE